MKAELQKVPSFLNIHSWFFCLLYWLTRSLVTMSTALKDSRHATLPTPPCLLWSLWNPRNSVRALVTLNVVTYLAYTHAVCGNGCSEWEGLFKHVAMCPLQLTEGCAGVLDLPHMEAMAKSGLHGPGACAHESWDAFCPFHYPGNCG